MHRLFIDSQQITGSALIISDREQVHHLRDVLRIKENEEITVCDEKGNEYAGIIENAESPKIHVKIKTKHLRRKDGQSIVTIACAIPKKAKFDEMIDKLTQLGVHKVIPMLTERVIVKLEQRKKAVRQQRWEKIALNASQQSQRNRVMLIDRVKTIHEVLQEAGAYDLKLIPVLFGERKTLQEVFTHKSYRSLLVLIGPEGDFTEEEAALAKKAGCVGVTLGDLVLRVDTAAIAVASFIRLTIGEHEITESQGLKSERSEAEPPQKGQSHMYTR